MLGPNGKRIEMEGLSRMPIPAFRINGAPREAVLRDTPFWSDESTSITIRDELAARHVVRNLAADFLTALTKNGEVLVGAENSS